MKTLLLAIFFLLPSCLLYAQEKKLPPIPERVVGRKKLPPIPDDPNKLLSVLSMKEGRVYYEGVIAVDSATKDALYQRAKRWVVDAYKSAKDVIQLDDPDNGELVVKGKFKTYWQTTFLAGQDVYIAHTISISVKDGKYRYQMTDFVVSGYNPSSQYSAGGPWEQALEDCAKGRVQNTQRFFQEKVEPEIQETIGSLKQAMLQPISAKQDW